MFGVDISGGVFDEAKKEFSRKPNIFVICGEIDYGPLPNNLFDSCVLFTVLQNLPKPEKTLDEIRRVVKKDALIVATYLKVKISLDKFRSLIGKAGFKGDVLDDPAINEYIFVGRIKTS
jgi:ubiquinone/menaquinone biosynthesis C-methylase UbiE